MYKRKDEEAADKKTELKITGVILKDGTKMDADAVIVATGGLSYPSTCLLYTSENRQINYRSGAYF